MCICVFDAYIFLFLGFFLALLWKFLKGCGIVLGVVLFCWGKMGCFDGICSDWRYSYWYNSGIGITLLLTAEKSASFFPGFRNATCSACATFRRKAQHRQLCGQQRELLPWFAPQLDISQICRSYLKTNLYVVKGICTFCNVDAELPLLSTKWWCVNVFATNLVYVNGV